jgi:hypothetical protein
MALILAIEPDRRQAAQLTTLIRARVGADLVLAATAEQALHAIGNRVPDLVLVPALLAPQDDATLAGALRVIAAAARIQMLTIPVLAPMSRKKQQSGMLAKWRSLRAGPAASGGCDPEVFGDQIAAYLAEAAAERAVSDSDRAAASTGSLSVDTAPVHSTGTAPVDDTAAIGAIALGIAAVTEVVRDLPDPLSFVTRPDLEGVKTDALPINNEASVADELPSLEARVDEVLSIEAPAAAGRFAAVEATAEDLPIAGDAISLSTTEDAWDTEDQTEFFLSAFHGEETPVEEPAVYEIQTDDLSMDVLSIDALSTDALSTDALSIEEQPAGSGASPDESGAPDDLSPTVDLATPPTPSRPLELSMALTFGTQPRWPALEGMVADNLPAAVRRIVEPQVTVEMTGPKAALAEIQGGEPPVARAAAVPPASKPEWLALIESLRRDVERLRGEHTPPPVAATARKPEAPRTAAPPVAPVAEPLPSPRTASIVDILTKARKRAGPAKPVQDEWGFFDPEQCGFAALLAKLDEITHLNDGA